MTVVERIEFINVYYSLGLSFLDIYEEMFLADSHELIVSDDLDCHLLAGSGSVPGSDHITEHTLACVAVHIIALVQCLANVHP